MAASGNCRDRSRRANLGLDFELRSLLRLKKRRDAMLTYCYTTLRDLLLFRKFRTSERHRDIGRTFEVTKVRL
jgi:hypothetical protein